MLCPICDSKSGVTIEFGADWSVVRCECSLEFLYPQPTADDLKEFYASEYRANSGTVMSRYLRDVYEAVERSGRLTLNENTRLLEMGSGSGAFLSVARSEIPKAWGVEPDRESWDWIASQEGLTVYRSVGELPEHDRFDLIVMFHVLEHLPDPVGFLKILKGKLAENGKIVVEVPNCDDAMLGNKAYRKKYFYQKAHLWYFNKATLSWVFDKADIDVEVSHIQRYNLRSRIRWMFRRRNNGDGQPGDLRKNWISEWYARRLIAWGKTDTLWATGG